MDGTKKNSTNRQTDTATIEETEDKHVSQTEEIKTLFSQISRKWRYDIRAFIIVNILISLAFSIYFSCLGAVLAPLAKQFHLTDSQIGFVNTVDDIGRIPFLLITGYFGSRWHVPRVLAASGFIYAVCSVSIVIPYFVFKHSKGMNELFNPTVTNFTNSMSVHYICNATRPDTESKAAADLEYADNVAYYVFMGSYVLMGVAASPWFSLHTWYLDENCDKNKFALLLGIMRAVSMAGPIIGTYLATAVNKLPVDLKSYHVSPNEPTFIGAWWLGLLISAVLLLSSCLLMCIFPRTMKSDKDIKQFLQEARERKITRKISHQLTARTAAKLSLASNISQKQINDEKLFENTTRKERQKMYTKILNNIYRPSNILFFLKRIAKNYIFLLIVLMFCAWRYEFGKKLFMFKIFAKQFDLPDWEASAIRGVESTITSVCTAFSVFLGGFIIHKLKPSFAQTAGFLAVVHLLSALCSMGTLFLGCDNFPLDGLNNTTTKDRSLQTDCNSNCSCHLYAYKPVCDNGITYFTPCHAGCTELNSTTEAKVFGNCACTASGYATNGACPPSCLSYYIYIFLQVAKEVIEGFDFSAAALILVRCLDSTEKAFGLGFRAFVSSLAAVPVSYVYGAAQDSACLVWQETFKTSKQRGVCWIYDLPLYRQRFWAIPLSCTLFIALIELLLMFMTSNKNITMYNVDVTVVSAENLIEGENGHVVTNENETKMKDRKSESVKHNKDNVVFDKTESTKL